MAGSRWYSHPRLWRWVRTKKTFFMRIYLWGGHIVALWGWQSKTQQPWGISGCLGAVLGAPMAGSVRYAHLGLRWGGRKKKETVLHEDILIGGSYTSFKFNISFYSKMTSTEINVTPNRQKIAKFRFQILVDNSKRFTKRIHLFKIKEKMTELRSSKVATVSNSTCQDRPF